MRRLLFLAALFALLASVFHAEPSLAQEPAPPLPPVLPPIEPGVAPGSFMGMVVRDPYYEWQTNSGDPSGSNRAFLEAMGANLQAAGVKRVRIEMFGRGMLPEHSLRDARPGVYREVQLLYQYGSA